MKTSRGWKNWLSGRARKRAVGGVPESRPLREFIYLDEVSLRSLLVSQNDTILEGVSRAISDAEEGELNGRVSAGVATVGKAEIESRYKTSNSSTVQTSRKAVVQTLFKELRDDKNLDYALVVRNGKPKKLVSDEEFPGSDNSGYIVPAVQFERGALVEIEVILDVDPVFKMGTLFSEFLSMAEEYPAMLGKVGSKDQKFLEEAQPVNKVLQRLLAGLIPIRAKALNYSVVTVKGVEYVVHNEAVADLEMEKRPLEVVGVTEHLGYWKDIRRVLFSSGKFTVLCRVSRDGLQRTWTPVKLADLFGDVAPSLVEQINAASYFGKSAVDESSKDDKNHGALAKALVSYKNKLLVASGVDSNVEIELGHIISKADSEAPSATLQRSAFRNVRKAVEDAGVRSLPSEDADLLLRKEARDEVGISLFPSLESKPVPSRDQRENNSTEEDRLLDVEVVAIYW
ncbi:hypothetical protein GCM10028793_23200 [Nocardiopsis oceani]